MKLANLSLFEFLKDINTRPSPFESYTAEDLWTDEYTSEQMLSYHLNGDVDVSSRRTEFIDRSAAWLVERFELDASKSVADFGCGPGLYTSRLARSGARVTGVDFSPRSIDYARRQAEESGIDIDYRCQNYLQFESESRFDLITMIYCDYGVLSPQQRRVLLQIFVNHLKPGGSVVLDVLSMNAFEQRQESVNFAYRALNGFWSPHPYYGFQNTFVYPEEKVVLDRHTIVEAERIRTVYNWFQHFSPRSLIEELEAGGLCVESVLADVAGTEYDPDALEIAAIAHLVR